MHRRLGLRCTTSFLILTAALASSSDADASCNLIPVAERVFPSNVARVASPVTAPGKVVRIRRAPECDGPGSFFDTSIVTLTFEPPPQPAAGQTTIVIPPANVTIIDETTLEIVMPDTDGDLAPAGDGIGLAGPARIRVEDASAGVIAEIGELFVPTTGCDLVPEDVFEQFTVLPTANVVADLANGTAQRILATVDGGQNLLIPLEHSAILPLGPAAPVARFLSGQSDIEAFSGGGQPLAIPAPSYVRSYTLDGRPLPPLLRVSDAGNELYGTADAIESVIRIARTDGDGGSPIYDFTDRLFGGTGPLVIRRNIEGFTVTTGRAIPLRGLRSSAGAVAFAADEALEGDLNFDGDDDDVVGIVIDAGTGVPTNVGRAVTQVTTGALVLPAIETDGSVVALLERESGQGAGVDRNGDGDSLDAILRVYDVDGTELTQPSLVSVSPARLVRDRSVAVSGGRVFFRTPTGSASFVGTETTGDGNSQTDVATVYVSPDGQNVYATSGGPGGTSLVAYTRDPATGALTVLQQLPGSGDSAMVLSGDGRFLYVAGVAEVRVFTRDLATGALALEQTVTDDIGGVQGLGTTRDVKLSPDERHLYVTAGDPFGTNDHAVTVLSRDASTGHLTFVQALIDGVGGVDGLDFPFALEVSADGANVYVSVHRDDAIVRFSRDAGSGMLVKQESYVDGVGGVDGIDAPHGIALSPDGKFLYAVGGSANAVAVFEIGANGTLTFRQVLRDGVGGVDGILSPWDVVVDPSGDYVYATGASEGFAVFARNGSTGLLTFVEAERDGQDGSGGIGGTQFLAISPDGASLYVPGSSQDVMAVYRTAGQLRVFDPATPGAVLPSTAIEASTIALAAGRAVFLTPEGNGGGSDINGDGDFADQVAHILQLDGGTERVESLDAATRVAISDQLAAITVSEAGQDATDRSGDGDTNDDVLAVVPLPLASEQVAATNTQIVANAIEVTGTTVVLTTPEAGVGPAGTDLNGDGDTGDDVLRLYQAAGPTPGVIEIRRAADDFVVGDGLVAFRVSEAKQANQVLNGDGDATDAVMQVYVLGTGAILSTGQAAMRCTLPGCDPFVPYRIKGTTVSFLTREADQGRDLNGDTDSLDIVLQVYDTRDRKLQVFDVSNRAQLDPLPQDFFGDPLLYLEAKDTTDIDGDGQTNDDVILLAGDGDGDGVYDDFDPCPRKTGKSLDTDLDGLGDTCDPTPFCGEYTPVAPPTAPAGAMSCQSSIGRAGYTYVSQRTAALQQCLEKVAKGKLGGEAAAQCIGSFSAGIEVSPLEPKTGAKIDKASDKLASSVESRCDDADLASLASCSDSATDLASCLLPGYGETTNVAADLAYGALTPIADRKVQACQVAVGRESRKYLRVVVQAMQGCLDRVNTGLVTGDAQQLCLGSLSAGAVVPPSDLLAQKLIAKADAKLRSALARKCGLGELASLDVCGGSAAGITTDAAAAACLTCSHWRRAVDSIGVAYGPR